MLNVEVEYSKEFMTKKEIMEKLEEKNRESTCALFEPSVCDQCAERFEWLYRVIKNSKKRKA